MYSDVESRLAQSLTADSADIIPYLPFLLQDFWSLASDPEQMADLLRSHTAVGSGWRVLDLACGKGAVAVYLAKAFGCAVKGVDLIAAFVAEAVEKARDHGVEGLCEFSQDDVNRTVESERGYDLAVWGGAGDLLGSYQKTLEGIARTVRCGGYILLDDCFVRDAADNAALRYRHNDNYCTESEWNRIFSALDLAVVTRLQFEGEADPAAYAEDLGNIRRRAAELTKRHPEKAALFVGYVRNQQAEYEDLQDGAIGAVWLLQKGEPEGVTGR